MPRNLVFHGVNAGSFSAGFAELLEDDVEIACLPDTLSDAERTVFESADVIIGTRLDDTLPTPSAALYQVAGAGIDGIDLQRLAAHTHLCNCYGHDQPIGEYVIGALINARIPFTDADRRLREGDWHYQSGQRTHGEIHGRTLGILGFGHIGQTIARMASTLGMRVHAANRSAPPPGSVDAAYGLDQLAAFYRSIDDMVVALPHSAETHGLVDHAAFAALPTDAHVINVGRGEVIQPEALYHALETRSILGATIDTWYRYPTPAQPKLTPSPLAFETLDNVVITPHMSGWTEGTIARRKQTMADNINRLMRGETLTHVVKAGG